MDKERPAAHLRSANEGSTVSKATDADVLVVGGGMAGLAGALAMRQNGAEVLLLERAGEFGEVGAGLQLGPNATRALQKWGLLDQVAAAGFRPRHLVFRDAISGQELVRHALGGAFEERYGAPYIVTHRGDLHRVLLQACTDSGVRLRGGLSVESTRTSEGIATAVTAAGECYSAPVILGADGLRSALRAQLVGDDVVPSGYVAYRGTMPMAEVADAQDTEDVVVYLGPHCHLVQYPLRQGELLNTVAVLKSRSFEDGIEQHPGREELDEAFVGCVPVVKNALDNLWHGLRWPMFDREPIDRWIDGRVALIGDAAHPMLQYLAQGACQALEDAAYLQQVTAGTVFRNGVIHEAAWDEALSVFESARTMRTARVQRTARLWGESWHLTGVGRTVRNIAFSSSSASDFRYTDWLYGSDS